MVSNELSMLSRNDRYSRLSTKKWTGKKWTGLTAKVIIWIGSERAIRRKRTEIMLPLACNVTAVSPDTEKRNMIHGNPPSSLTISGDWPRGTAAVLFTAPGVTRGIQGSATVTLIHHVCFCRRYGQDRQRGRFIRWACTEFLLPVAGC